MVCGPSLFENVSSLRANSRKKKNYEMKRPVHGVKPELVMPDRLVICVQPK